LVRSMHDSNTLCTAMTPMLLLTASSIVFCRTTLGAMRCSALTLRSNQWHRHQFKWMEVMFDRPIFKVKIPRRLPFHQEKIMRRIMMACVELWCGCGVVVLRARRSFVISKNTFTKGNMRKHALSLGDGVLLTSICSREIKKAKGNGNGKMKGF
jgi:hypothetical protein